MAQGDTTITVAGNITGDPELRFTASGGAVASFTVATNPRTFDRTTNEWKDGDPIFFRCSAWRQMAENVAESLTKGTRVIVTGTLKVSQYEGRDGVQRTSVDINVDEVGPSLRFATAKVTRTGGGGGQQGGGYNNGGNAGGGYNNGGGQGGYGGGNGGYGQQNVRQQQPVDPWSQAPQTDDPPF